MPACIQCQSATNCSLCVTGHYLVGYNLAANSCLKCPAGCVTCYDASVCAACHVGYYLTPGKACSMCTLPCISCSAASGGCLQCAEGYILSSSNCVACSSVLTLPAAARCLTCNSDN